MRTRGEVDVSALLRRFQSKPIDGVWLLRHEVGLVFDGGGLTCVRFPRIRAGERELPVGSGEWLRALWACIGETPRDARVDDGGLAFALGAFHLSIAADAPECAILDVEGAGMLVF